ncbi:hypothetical protein L6452_18595 [Arctium lappa]|uniref:Uncharacterized protein n=1 Tax=Arctium lappa TaxID=4217 RepID=A0ACB9C6L8_ARCLA|nr:hypothetical protein L6452_18595 [Arctium lappa]
MKVLSKEKDEHVGSKTHTTDSDSAQGADSIWKEYWVPSDSVPVVEEDWAPSVSVAVLEDDLVETVSIVGVSAMIGTSCSVFPPLESEGMPVAV